MYQLVLVKVKNMSNVRYSFGKKATIEMSQAEIQECSELYNNNYGNYRMDSKRRPGEKIIFSPQMYQRYVREDFYIATARYDNELIAHAFYIRKKYPDYGTMTWVLQLVVSKKHRKQGIASKLLHSIWGFSNDYAWGLATANPCTVKTLESATYRRCKPSIIMQNLDAVRTIGNDVQFIGADDYEVDSSQSCVNSRFFVDNSSYDGISDVVNQLGELKPGYEWLAMTFQKQTPEKKMYEKHFKDLIEFSEQSLKDAYARMHMENHAWTSKTEKEIDFIEPFLQDTTVLDLGCGIGRHSIELTKRGYSVTGIDFVKSNIESARRKAEEQNVKVENFLVDDIRGTRFGSKYDNVVCLFDVVGSFPDEKDNEKILKTAHDNLKEDGILVLSVMNMELTEAVVPNCNKLSVKANPSALFNLKASNAMQNKGEIFCGEKLLIDKDTGVIYRKEQFENNDALSAEYVIRDRRYRMKDIVALVERKGFEIIDNRYTCAGFERSLSATEEHAKEILIIARKK